MKASLWILVAGSVILCLSCSFHPALDTEKYWPCMPGSVCPDGCQCLDGQVCVPEDRELDGSICRWCPENYADCDHDVATRCEVELMTDEHNWCGCGVWCREGMYCQGARCLSECSQGLTPCEGWCLNMMTDPENCGTCGHECGSGKVCNQGFCDTNCGDLVECEGSCVELDSNSDHCGECGNACDAWSACCDGSCRSVKYDEQNCGGCAVTCPPMQACDHMVCRECIPPEEFCDNHCHDTSTCSDHCGGCGIECAEGEICVVGVCVLDNCEEPLSPCPDGCVDLMNDRKNCGSCGNLCADPQKCESGECVDVCQPGFSYCENDCVNTNTNDLHCGGCNRPCDNPPPPVCDDTGQGREVFSAPGTCESGECRYPSATEPCQFGCREGFCLEETCAGEYCTDYEYCNGTQCVCTATDEPCPADQECCETGCSDLLIDSSNCGQCGKSCGDYAHCNQGECLCLQDFGNCDNDWGNGCEEYLIDNLWHCGDCLNDCSILPPPECIDGTTLVTYHDSVCEQTQCGYFQYSEQCPGGCQDGVCHPDPCADANCTEEETCVEGVCYCNLDPALVCPNDTTCCASQCVYLQSSLDHCGGCYQACLDTTCVQGQCGKVGVECGAAGLCSDISVEYVCCAMGMESATCTLANSCDAGLVACDGPEDCPGQWEVCCHSPQTPGTLAECLPDDSCVWGYQGQVLCHADYQCEWLGPNYGCCPLAVPGLNLHVCSEACK